MILKLHTKRLQTVEEIRSFLAGATTFDFEPQSREETYRWVRDSLRQLLYSSLRKADRGAVKEYLQKVTGLSRAQVARLIRQYQETGGIRDHRGRPARPFPRRYKEEDAIALAKMDALHGTLSGPATRKLCERAWEREGDADYERLATISNGHLYNLRKTRCYKSRRRRFEKTRPNRVGIGERRKPRPDGQPGFLRIDTVHQGDLDGVKGVYHINAVDEVTQWEVAVSVEKISEAYLMPALEKLLEAFPFVILGFHSDNGSEYVNKRVAYLQGKFVLFSPKRGFLRKFPVMMDWIAPWAVDMTTIGLSPAVLPSPARVLPPMRTGAAPALPHGGAVVRGRYPGGALSRVRVRFGDWCWRSS